MNLGLAAPIAFDCSESKEWKSPSSWAQRSRVRHFNLKFNVPAWHLIEWRQNKWFHCPENYCSCTNISAPTVSFYIQRHVYVKLQKAKINIIPFLKVVEVDQLGILRNSDLPIGHTYHKIYYMPTFEPIPHQRVDSTCYHPLPWAHPSMILT